MKYEGKKAGMMPAATKATSSTPPPVQKTGTTDGKPNNLGGGGRFQQMVNQGKSPALAAFIGRKMYGKKRMSKMASKGETNQP